MAVRIAAGRRKRPGAAVYLGFALSATALAGVATNVVLAAKPAPMLEPMVVAEFDTVDLPVPAQMIPAGTRLRNVPIKMVAFPRRQVPSGALTDLGNYFEAATVAPLPANLPIFPENLSLHAGSSNPVVERIPEGMRAMTIRVDATTAVEGWAGSGSLVDVLLIERDQTTVVAEQVKVLSAERSVQPVEGSAVPSVPSTVTLLVTQEQCLAINTAIPRGKIAFALRNAKDGGRWTSTSYDAVRLVSRDTKPKAIVSGYAAVSGDNDSRFTLADGKWLPANTVPEGFFISQQVRAVPQK